LSPFQGNWIDDVDGIGRRDEEKSSIRRRGEQAAMGDSVVSPVAISKAMETARESPPLSSENKNRRCDPGNGL